MSPGYLTRPTMRELNERARTVIAAAFPDWILVPGDDRNDYFLNYHFPVKEGSHLWCIARRTGDVGCQVQIVEPRRGEPAKLTFAVTARHYPSLDAGGWMKPTGTRKVEPATVSMDRPPAQIAADITRRIVKPYLDGYYQCAVDADTWNASQAKRVQLVTDLMAAAGTVWPQAAVAELEPYARKRELYGNQSFCPGRNAGGKPTLVRELKVGGASKEDENRTPSIAIETGTLTKAEALEVIALLTRLAASREAAPRTGMETVNAHATTGDEKLDGGDE